MTDFVAAVADQAGREVTDVRDVLAAYGVASYTPRGRAARLRLTKLSFAGFKDPDSESPADSFEFEWTLTPGVHALASTVNNVGKTSVLEIIRWMLTGSYRHSAGGLDDRVRAMLRWVALEFELDGDPVTVQVDAGAVDEPGSLHVGTYVIPFTKETMADVVGALMLDRLRLPRIVEFTHPGGSKRGIQAEQSWPLFAGALVVAPTHLGAVIGTVPIEAGRVLQVYMALPWYETLTQARAARSGLKQDAGDRRKAAEAEDKARGSQTERLREELKAAEKALAAMPDESVLLAKLAAAIDEAGLANREVAKAETAVHDGMEALDAAGRVHLDAQREYVTAVEHEGAKRFFRALDPAMCPRCDAVIDDERRDAEHESHTCAVCTRQHDPEPDEEAEERAREAAERTALAVEAAEARLQTANATLSAARRKRAESQAEVESLGKRRGGSERERKVLEVERLRGRLDERSATALVAQTPAEADPEVAILDAAVKEAERRVAEHDELMERINERIHALGQAFGVKELASVKLDRGGKLPVYKGATRTNFSRLAEGDQLRLKVAVVVALLQIGAERGAGHHPGLLLVDSPGAQEVGSEPLEAMLRALRTVAEDHDIQVLVGTARRDEAVAALGTERVRQPDPEGSTLW